MSHDQRPAKLRVVQDASGYNPVRRRGDEASARVSEDTSVPPALAAKGVTGAAGKPGSQTATLGLGVFPIAVFMIACVAGGICFALWRPF